MRKAEPSNWLSLAALARRLLGNRTEADAVSPQIPVPPQPKPAAPAFDIRPKPIRQWIADLPLTNVGETGKLLYQALLSTNPMHISAKARLGLLEELRSPVRYVMRSLRRHYVGVGFPLPKKNKQVAKLAEAMCSEMAAGYKSVTRDLLAGSRYTSRDRLALAMHRSIRYLSQVLLVNCHAYTPCPAGVWLELHQIYRQAEQHGLADRRVGDDSYELVRRATVGDAYRQILMLALTDPYRLPQSETENVYVALELWSPLVTLRPYREDAEAPRSFMVNLARDGAPLTFSFKEEPVEACRLIDGSRLVPILREENGRAAGRHAVAEAPAPARKPGEFLSETTLAHLAASWDNKPERRSTRVRKPMSVKVVRGLNSIHQALLGGQEEDPPIAAPEVLVEEPVSTLGMPLQLPEIEELPHPSHPASWADPKRTQRGATQYECQTQDQSVGGCRLSWSARDLVGINIGELVSVSAQQADAGLRHRLGVVRWMRQDQGERLETGVQWLAPQIVPVWTESVYGPETKREYLRALMLPERRLSGYSFTLITGPLSYRVGNEVTVRNDDSTKRLRLRALAEKTAAYAQFQAAPVERRRTPEGERGTSTPPEATEQNDFDTLWERL
jgi:hypothetical protein